MPGKIQITEGTGAKNLATHSISEDSITKELQRVVLSDQTGKNVNYGPSDYIGLALEDSLFIGSNGVIGTAVPVNSATRASFLQTDPSFLIRNPNSAGGKNIFLKRIKLICATAGLLGADLQYAIFLTNTNNYTSGGTSVLSKSLLSQSSATAQTYVGGNTAIVATGTNSVLHSRGRLRTGIPVAGDTYKFNFGGEPTTETGLLSGTTASLFALNLPPAIIAPGGTALIYLWSTAQTGAPTYEFTIEHIER